MTIEILRSNAIRKISDFWKKYEDINNLINGQDKEEILNSDWEEEINSLKERADIDEARDSLIDLISWEMPVIFENLTDKEIDFTNETEFGQDVNENFKKYNGKRLIFRNCTNLKRIEVDCLNLIGLEIENCPKLEHLSAYNNRIRELDLSRVKVKPHSPFLSVNNNLKTVYVPYNKQLEIIDLKDCHDLENLNVSGSQIDELDLTNNTKLKHLNCDNTLIRELNIKHLSELETLYCFKCYLSNLDCSGLEKLKDLNFAGNIDYEKIPFLELKKLRSTKILLEGLKKLELKDCWNLEVLDCAENSITKLELSSLKNLNFVSARENSLKQLNINACSKT